MILPGIDTSEAMLSLSKGLEQANEIVSRGRLSLKGTQAAVNRAINVTMRSYRASLSKDIASEAEARLRLVSNRFFVANARKTGKTSSGKVVMLSQSMPAILFNPQQTATGVRAGRRFFRGAFIAPRRKGQTEKAVYKRATKARLPLKSMRIPIAEISERQFKKLGLDKNVLNKFLRNMLRELKFKAGFII